jgi:alkylation response protein AidB-like acyl-CoA dehydrogenase
MKGSEFLTKDASHNDIFTYEDFNEEQKMMYSATKEFVEKEVLSNIDKIEKQDGDIVPDTLKKAGSLGLLGISIPEEFGGLGMSFNTSMLIADIIGVAGSFGTTFGAHTGIGTLPILYYGTDKQKEKYMPGLSLGKLIGCYCLTEPGAGSDANAGKTNAKLSDDGKNYIINGQKIWISNGGFADIMIVFAKIGTDKNHSAFIVESKSEGITMGPEEVKLGIKGSSTRQIYYENVEVPVENLLGDRGQGFEIALNILNIGRIKLCSSAIGGAKKLIEQTEEYVKERKQFGRPIGTFGAIQQKIARMKSKTFASESLMYRAGQDIENRGEEKVFDPKKMKHKKMGIVEATSEYAIECAIAKVHGSEVLDYVADEAIQCHGGMGYSAEFPIERAYRDSRISRIYEGTNEINRMLLVGQVLKKIKNNDISIDSMVKKPFIKLITDLFKCSYSGMDLVKNHKMISSVLIYTLYKRFGKQLRNQQEILLSMADIIIEIYASESAILRANKTGDNTQKHMSDLYLYESNQKVKEKAYEIIDASSSGFKRFLLKKLIGKFMNHKRINPYYLHTLILYKEGYSVY